MVFRLINVLLFSIGVEIASDKEFMAQAGSEVVPVAQAASSGGKKKDEDFSELVRDSLPELKELAVQVNESVLIIVRTRR